MSTRLFMTVNISNAFTSTSSIVFTDKLVHYTTGDNIGSPGGHGFESRQVHTVNTVHGTMTLAGNSSLTIREKNCNYFTAHTHTV